MIIGISIVIYGVIGAAGVVVDCTCVDPDIDPQLCVGV